MQSPITERFASTRARLSGVLASEEVDRDPRLKVICGCLLFFFHETFHDWWEKATSLSTLGDKVFDYAPAPVLENFRGLVCMDLFQTKTYFYGLGMLALLGLFSLFTLRSSLLAMCLLVWLFVNKVFFYLCDFRLFANYHHFHLLYTFTFLVAHDKLRFFRGALGLSYLLSGIVKLTPSWLYGEYFNSLEGRLPMLPKLDWVVTAACVSVVVLECLGPICWLTSIRWLRRLSFGAFILFHVYSGVIVGFWYTTLMLPLVLAAFWGFSEPLFRGYRFTRQHLVPIGLFAVALLGGVYHYFIPGDVRLTSEGRYFGLFMFDAHHSLRFQAKILKDGKLWVVQVFRKWQKERGEKPPDSVIVCSFEKPGEPKEIFYVTEPIRDGDEVIFNPNFFTSARLRLSGDPYLYYFYARELIRHFRPDQVSIFLEQRLDGHLEAATLLDIPDFAKLNPSYKSFQHNDWILLPGPESPAGYRWP